MNSGVGRVALLVTLLVGGCSLLEVGTNPPNTPTIPSGPSSGRPGIAIDFSSSATDPDADNVCIRFSWGDGDTSAWSAMVASGATVTSSHTWASDGNYQVTAQAKDAEGKTSGWSGATTISIAAGGNAAPNAPSTPSGPSSGGIGGSLTYSSSATDPDGDNVALRFSWGDGDTSGWSALVPSGTPTSSSHAWASAGTYQVSAQAKDANGATSAWSASLPVTITQGGGGGTPGTLKWRYVVGKKMVSSPAIGADGTIYIGSEDSALHAVNPDGSRKWRYPTWNIIWSSPAVGADGVIYFGSNDFALYAVNPDSSPRWSHRTDGAVGSSPAIGADGTVFVGSDDNYVYAVGSDGTRRWRYARDGNVRSSPAVGGDGTVYVGTTYWGYFLALDPDLGTKRWEYRTNEIYASPAIGADGTIYIGSTNDYLYAFWPDGRVRWSYHAGGDVSSPAVGNDSTVYVGSNDGYVYALSADSGKLRWRYKTGGYIWTCPAVASDGTIYVTCRDKCIYALKPDGSLLWKYQATDAIESSPNIGTDGTVYFGCNDGCLYAVYGSAPLATNAPWPKFHHDIRNTGRVGGGD